MTQLLSIGGEIQGLGAAGVADAGDGGAEGYAGMTAAHPYPIDS
jgi:hypothetical protein